VARREKCSGIDFGGGATTTAPKPKEVRRKKQSVHFD
jgi:hypothetical protein